MDKTDKLIELFREFPGIGPRQAKRFVYFLLHKNPSYTTELSKLITEVRDTIHNCSMCFRFFQGKETICSICRDQKRDNKLLMIVSHDIDFENIEKAKVYNGHYFILGGIVPILEKNPEKKIRQKELLETIKKGNLKEIILALNYNPEGENTRTYLENLLSRGLLDSKIKISTLGRGLSLGTELEYSDPDTIKNALKNRG